MNLQPKYNLKSPGVKRLMREAAELSEPTEEYNAKPLDDNLFEWHFTVRGPPGSNFDGGLYHGRILLPTQYPMQPPNIILLTPNGRFETNKKICLSISGHHPESWQPSWSIRTALLALIAFMPTPAAGTIGSLDYTPEERQILAKKSQSWECPTCGKLIDLLSKNETGNKLGTSKPLTEEETSLIQEISLKAEEDAVRQQSAVKENGESAKPPTVNNPTPTPMETSNTDTLNSMQTVDQHNMLWNIAIGLLLSVIGLLIFRRLFLIY